MSVDRRRFLAGTAIALGGAAVAGCGNEARDPLARSIAFDGTHQSGILRYGDEATFVALDAIAPDRATLAGALQALSSRARELSRGGATPTQEIDEPPADSGTLGTHIAPDELTVTLGFGASVFDERYGLARPAVLTPMPAFADDELDPGRAGGDLLLSITAQHRDTVVHALRELLRPVRGALALRWTIDGFQSAARGSGARRNLFGFRDGTANPDVSDSAAMRRLVFDDSGGTVQVIRTIRMHVEFWDRVGLREQEQMIGRSRSSGAPLGGTSERQDPRYDLDAEGARIPLDAHIRTANPRTPATASQRILRRGYNFHRGVDSAGQLDQGLIFTAYNRDPARQFAVIQRRLAGEPMTDYITTVGGGYFYAPRGARALGDWVGSGMFT